jgi:N4-gp56 family major capsid protein
MSTTSFGVGDAMAVKLWSKEVAEAERDTSDIAKLMGEDDDSIIQIKSDTSKQAGDQITFALRARLSGKGFTEGQKAQGNAEGLSFYSQALLINELGQTVGVRNKGATIDAQRIPFDLREQGKNGLVQWWKDRKSVSFFNHVCGYLPANTESATAGSVFCGLNTVTAHTSTRKIFAGTATTDELLTSSDTFTVALLDKAKEIASTGSNMVRPIMIGGQPKYVCYLDPAQVTSLRTNATSGGWLDITKAAMAGSEATKSPIYTGALGEWNGIVLRSSQDVTQGVNSSSSVAITTVRRAVLLGAQAAVCGYGKSNSYGPMKYRWSEELFDHDRELELGAWSIWGLKKTVFNAIDFGTVTISTYAVRQS